MTAKCECKECKEWNALDRLVQAVTAFRDWNDLVRSMGTPESQKYVPTLNGGGAAAKLAGIVRRNGFKVFRLGMVA